MRALTLTQPWAALVACGLKLVENRPRKMIKASDFGDPFAIHASRVIDEAVYPRIAEIAPELVQDSSQLWYRLSRVTSAVIGVATIDKLLGDNWAVESLAEHAASFRFGNGELLGPQQVRWMFGPVAYALRDCHVLGQALPCRGYQGFWTLPPHVAADVATQLCAA